MTTTAFFCVDPSSLRPIELSGYPVDTIFEESEMLSFQLADTKTKIHKGLGRRRHSLGRNMFSFNFVGSGASYSFIFLYSMCRLIWPSYPVVDS